MHILLVSQCKNSALVRTRKIADSFAARVGERTWATPITQEGLDSLKVALKKGSSRNTAIACYQNEGTRRMRLLWVVGSKKAFGPEGQFPISSRKASLEKQPTLDWVRLGGLIVRASGLAHDFGKGSAHFQSKLRADSNARIKDVIRHEWISLKILQNIRQKDSTRDKVSLSQSTEQEWQSLWEEAWKDFRLSSEQAQMTLNLRKVAAHPRGSLAGLSSAVEVIDLLVCTHHGLLSKEVENNSYILTNSPSEKNRLIQATVKQGAQVTPGGLVSQDLVKKYLELESRAVAMSGEESSLFWQALWLYTRAALIFADHTVSARDRTQQANEKSSSGSTLYANTRFDLKTESRVLNQSLDWHLENVSSTAGSAFWRFAQATQPFSSQNGAENAFSGLSEETVRRIQSPSKRTSRFVWQNRAAQALEAARAKFAGAPALVFNMAGTGSGKTRMNIRALCSLSECAPRIVVALNLRTLTLQTGHALQTGFGIPSSEMATIIGDKVAAHLFSLKSLTGALHADELSKNEVGDGGKHTSCTEDSPADEEERGSGLSAFSVDDEERGADYTIETSGGEYDLPDWIAPLFRDRRERAVVGAPLLVSTIDFLSAAASPQSQGQYVKSFCRLMTSDLVLDEVDSYEPKALVAVSRIVQLVAFFGKNVVCSSATISLIVAQTIHQAFLSGVAMREALHSFQSQKTEGLGPILDQEKEYIFERGEQASVSNRTRSEARGEELNLGPKYLLSFIDDSPEESFIQSMDSFETGEVDFTEAFSTRAKKLIDSAACQPIARLAESPSLTEIRESPSAARDTWVETWIQSATSSAKALHQRHAWTHKASGKKISVGLVRVANIKTAIRVARELAARIPEARVACYHSNLFRIQRFHIEQRLDTLLDRTAGDHTLQSDRGIGDLAKRVSGENLLLIVVATPVEEIGRDHDFDWGIIDASSSQSIVQASGRINRHRLTAVTEPNVVIPQFNLRYCQNQDTNQPNHLVFSRPGYEKRNARASKSGYGTHNLHDLLPWVNGRVTVTAALRLNSRVQFSAADDESIQTQIRKWTDHEKGFFSRAPQSGLWVSEMYRDTPVRESVGGTSEWVVAFNDGVWDGGFLQKILHPPGKSNRFRWTPELSSRKNLRMAPSVIACSQAWLSIPLTDLAVWSARAGLQTEEGASVSLALYMGESAETVNFLCDPSFGVYRA